MGIWIYISIITLNGNGLNAPQIKRYKAANWMKKQELTTYCLKETHFRTKDIHTLEVREWKKTFHDNGNIKKVGVAILMSEKTRF